MSDLLEMMVEILFDALFDGTFFQATRRFLLCLVATFGLSLLAIRLITNDSVQAVVVSLIVFAGLACGVIWETNR